MLKNEKFNFQEIQKFLDFLKIHTWEQMTVPSNEFSFEMNDENLEVSLWGLNYPLRETVKQSLFQRYGINGKTLYQCSDKELFEILGILKGYVPEYLNIMLCDGIANSVNSKSYAHIPLQDIVEETTQAVLPFYENDDIAVAIDYDYSKCRVVFKTDRLFSFANKENNLIITLTNSECGDAAVRFGAYIGGYIMAPIMDDITIVHTGDADIKRVHKAISELEAIVTKNFNAVKLLESIEVTAPVTAIKELCKDAGIPKKYQDDAYASLGFPRKTFASDIYMALAKAIREAETSEECKEKHRNNLLKLVFADWSKYSSSTDSFANIPMQKMKQQPSNTVASLLKLF